MTPILTKKYLLQSLSTSSSSVLPHGELLKIPKIRRTPREILSSIDHYYISFYPSFQLPIYWRRLMCAGNTILPNEEEISKRKVARIRQTTETLETLIVVENRDTCRKILKEKQI